MPKFKPKKFLRCSDEEMFQLLLLACGPPDIEVRRYEFQVGAFTHYGLHAWLEHSAEGQVFTRMVRNQGEAKIRVHKVWTRYLRWWDTR
ncbi:MAG: hypothetical protein HC794_01160 [Nitrospiraceae bacterium]|nr:hypothetical protein [Nitrospiraceae bacterium]